MHVLDQRHEIRSQVGREPPRSVAHRLVGSDSLPRTRLHCGSLVGDGCHDGPNSSVREHWSTAQRRGVQCGCGRCSSCSHHRMIRGSVPSFAASCDCVSPARRRKSAKRVPKVTAVTNALTGIGHFVSAISHRSVLTCPTLPRQEVRTSAPQPVPAQPALSRAYAHRYPPDNYPDTFRITVRRTIRCRSYVIPRTSDQASCSGSGCFPSCAIGLSKALGIGDSGSGSLCVRP